MSDLAEVRALRKAAWRLLPLLCVLYICNLLNRSNVGFARVTMDEALDLSASQSSFAYGVFYFGYLVFQVPANLLLPRVGARRWIALLMVCWGLVSCATMLASGPVSLYLLRILLGIAQAGFFPGIILYLTFWFPNRERARVISLFMMANAIAGMVGNPLHGAIMQGLESEAGLAGWQWLFVLESIPTILLAFVVLFLLPDGPAQAHWLTAEESDRLRERISQEGQAQQTRDRGSLLLALVDVRVWLLIAVYFTVAVGANAGGAHFPKLVKEQFKGEREFTLGLLVALPHLCSLIGMTIISLHSDRTGERQGHVCASALLAAAGWTLAARGDSPWLVLGGLCLAQTGMMSMLPCFWAMPTAYLSKAAAAGGIALINSMGNLGGLAGPNILEEFGLEAMAGILATGAILVLFVRRETVPEAHSPRAPA
jgi:ACS family tartrate transporter-like MFS transporter